MPRHKTPSKILELKGRYRHDPQRRPKNEPVPSKGIGSAPAHFDDQHRAAWEEVIAQSPPGVLGNSDRIALEVLVNLLVQYRAAGDEFPATRLRALTGLLGRFGFSPADRHRIGVPTGRRRNPFADL